MPATLRSLLAIALGAASAWLFVNLFIATVGVRASPPITPLTWAALIRWYFIVASVLFLASGIAAGFITAWVAGKRPLLHGIVAIPAAIAVNYQWYSGNNWWDYVFATLLAVGILMGCMMVARHQRAMDSNQPVQLEE